MNNIDWYKTGLTIIFILSLISTIWLFWREYKKKTDARIKKIRQESMTTIQNYIKNFQDMQTSFARLTDLLVEQFNIDRSKLKKDKTKEVPGWM